MRRHEFVWAFAVIAILAVAAYPQSLNSEIRVSIPYPFMVAGTQLPAGDYIIGRAGITSSLLVVRSESTKKALQVDVLTRIDGRANSENEARVVLDKFEGEKYALSEVFFPGEDGFLVAGAKNMPHKHETVKASKKG